MQHAHTIKFFTKRIATEITGGVSTTSKMPCRSWSIPVFMCKRGAVLAKIPGSTCAICYADKGNYHQYRNNIEPAQVARLDAFYADPALWIQAMVALIGDDPFFRWFDAGDLQDVDMLWAIAAVCRATPNTRHWLPTREYEIVAAYLADYGPLPENLTVRLSAFMIDQPAKIPRALRDVPNVTTSEVHTTTPTTNASTCPAPTQGNKCGSCRACWSRDVPTVSYHAH
jgi:hypothetical protein